MIAHSAVQSSTWTQFTLLAMIDHSAVQSSTETLFILLILLSGADPGFPVGGGANPTGVPTYDFAKFCEKLHEIEKILGRRGVHAGGTPPNPPLTINDRSFCHPVIYMDKIYNDILLLDSSTMLVPYRFHFTTVIDVTQGGCAHDRVNLNKKRDV